MSREEAMKRHPAYVHWARREAALADEGTPRLSWWQRFKNRPRHATFRMMWRY